MKHRNNGWTGYICPRSVQVTNTLRLMYLRTRDDARRDRPVNSQLVNLIPLMGLSEILLRINIATVLIPVPLGARYCWPRWYYRGVPDGRGRLQNDTRILCLVRLLSIWGYAAPFGINRRILRLFCAQETKHNVGVSDGRKNHGHVPHLYVLDSQVWWLDFVLTNFYFLHIIMLHFL